MAFGLGLNLGFQSLKPEDDEEMKLVLSIGSEFAKKYGKPTPELKRRAQEEINGALSDYRRRRYSQSMTGPDMASNLAEPLMQHDFSAGLMQDPPEIDPSVMSNIGTAETLYGINTRRAHEKAAQPWDMGEMSTFEKVAGIGGLVATGLGMAGVGGKRTQAALGAVGKRGLGHALGAPQRYRQRQDRTLQSELAQAQAGRYEALGIPRAQQQQYEYDKEYSGDMFGRDETRGDFLLRAAGQKQSADELKARQTGRGRYIPYDKQLYYEALQYMERGGTRERMEFVLSPAHAAVYEDYGPIGDPPPSELTASQLSELAGKEFEAKQEGFQTQFQDYMGTHYPDEYQGWLRGLNPALSDLAETAKSPDLMLEDKQWPQSNIYGADPTAASLADSMMHYRDMTNLPGYQLERAADEDWVSARQPKLKGKSKRRWAPTSPDQYAKEWGFDSVQAAIADLEAKKDTMSATDYQKYRQMLGY